MFGLEPVAFWSIFFSLVFVFGLFQWIIDTDKRQRKKADEERRHKELLEAVRQGREPGSK